MNVLSANWQGKANSVLCTELDLRAMAHVWLGSGLPNYGFMVSFAFDSHGLCDISWYSTEGIDVAEPEGIDQACLLALSQDAQEFLNVHNRQCA